MKLNSVAFANAAAILDGAAHLLFAVLESSSPGTVAWLMERWIQGVSFQVRAGSVWDGFLLGWISEIVVTWIFVYLLVWLYNRLAVSE